MFSEARGYNPEQEFSGKNYYEILGVSVDATQAEIKKAFHKLAKEHHSDVGGNEEKFKYIAEAYNELKDEKNRRRYDFKNNINRAGSKPPEDKDSKGKDSDVKEDEKPKEPEETPDWNRVRRTEDYAGREVKFESKLKINQKDGYYFLVNEQGKEVSRRFRGLETLGTYFVGTNSIDLRYLVDPVTGHNLGRTYKQILFRDGVVIGKTDEGVEHLINKTSGREIGDVNGYREIKRRGNKVVGIKNNGSEEEVVGVY